MGSNPERSNSGSMGNHGLPYDPYQNYGDHQQPRSISTSSPSHLPEGVRTSLSNSSSPLHHSEYPSDNKGFPYQQQYGYSTPIRNQDSHTPSSQYYNQHQQPRPQLRHHPHQRKANREGGVYYNVQQQPGRQSVISPHYLQGRKLTMFVNDFCLMARSVIDLFVIL